MSQPAATTPSSSPPQIPGRLQSRIAFVTGSSGRLGRAISLLFARSGATLFLVDKYALPRNPINVQTGKADDWETRYDREQHQSSAQPPSSSSTPSSTPSSSSDDDAAAAAAAYQPTHEYITQHIGAGIATFHAADLTHEPSVAAAMAACVTLHGRIDILINAHGISVESTHARPLPIHLTPLPDFEKTMSINTTSLFLTVKHFLAHVMGRAGEGQLFEGGRAWIVNVASVQALTPYYGTSSYCASKGAALMLTRQVALDYAGFGVRCNAVCPGFLDSDMTRNLQGDQAVLGRVAARHPLDISGMNTGGVEAGAGGGKGGLGDVRDVARVVLVLASDDARWMTGQGVVVDGGYSVS